MAGMSSDSNSPNRADEVHTAVNTNGQLPDCIIASSNRFNDLLPFCTDLYYANPQKWGGILPWEFPHNASKEVEEVFLRKWFTELEIHMQGGAHGEGAGFRFLKQAWYNIALWNYEQRVPSIATWWLQQPVNSDMTKDPKMLERLCGAQAGPETCFNSREVEFYGRNLLTCVVKQIQDKVKSEKDGQAEASPHTSIQQATTEASPKTNGKVETTIPSVTLPSSASDDQSTTRSCSNISRASTKPATIDSQITPFPNYQQPTPEPHGNNKGFRDFTPGHGNHTQQVYGRKHDGRFGSGGGVQGSSHDRRQQQNQPYFANTLNHPPGLWDPNKPGYNGDASNFFPASGRAGAAVPPNGPFPLQVVPSLQGSTQQTTNAPRHPTYGQHFGPNENYHQGFVNPASYTANAVSRPDHQYAFGGQFAHVSEKDRVSSGRSNDMFQYSGFNDISNSRQSGDARRNSFTSRGNGHRGQNRGGRGRGGRARDSTNDFGSYARKPSSDLYSKPSLGHNKRHGSMHYQDTWRSGSDQPQAENAQPQRVFSEPERVAPFQSFQGHPQNSGQPQLLPPFNNSQSHPMGYQARHSSILRHPPSEHHFSQSPTSIDADVTEQYIGADATHAIQLLVYNIPIGASEDEVKKDFGQTCDVEVTKAHIPKGTGTHQCLPGTTVAYLSFKTHDVARRVLDLREVKLYGHPMEVKVPMSLWSDVQAREQQNALYQHSSWTSSGKTVVPPGEFTRWTNVNPQNSMPTMQAMAGGSYTVQHEGIHLATDYTAFGPSTPSNRDGSEMPSLPTVQSANTTPATSGPNTPKKGKQKKKKSNRNITPLLRTPGDKKSTHNVPDRHPAGDAAVKAQSQKHQAAIPGATDPAIMDQREEIETPASNTSVASKELPKETSLARESQSTVKLQASDSAIVPVQEEPVLVSQSQGNIWEKKKSDHKAVRPAVTQDPPSSTPQTSGTGEASGVVAGRHEASMVTTHRKPSTPPSGGRYPRAADKTSDSDHVDDSFHTANASPPGDKQPQSDKATQNQDRLVSHASSKHPASALSISVQSPTPSKKQSEGESKLHVNLASGATTRPAKSDNTEQSISLPDASTGNSKEHDPAKPATQRVPSGTSIPPTPMTAYHTAPTTPAPPQTPMSPQSTEKIASQPKSATKKGPSQTESFSMFGKKQQKQKKQGKSKGTIKGKPQESSQSPKFTGDLTGRDLGCATTPLPSSDTKNDKKPELKLKIRGDSMMDPSDDGRSKGSSTPANSGMSDQAASALGEQSSPSKRTFGNLFGLLQHGTSKSPSLSGKETVQQGTVSDNELTNSKAQANTTSATIGNDPATLITGEESHSEDPSMGHMNTALPDEGAMAVCRTEDIADSAEMLDAEPCSSNSSNAMETPKKTRKKKSKKTKTHTTEEFTGVIGDQSQNMISTAPRFPMANTVEPNDTESDDKSDNSSRTLGRSAPVSPTNVSPSRREMIERKKSEHEHLLTARAPRNKHTKRKSSNKIATPATDYPVPEPMALATSASPESETTQRNRILRVCHISDEEMVLEVVGDEAQEDRPARPFCVVANWSEGENAQSVPIMEGLRLALRVKNDDDDAVSQQALPETQSESQSQVQGRVQEELHSDDE
ncbi:hypothetical protein Q7P37_011337 [Cladosporium fusiforme]